MKPQVTILLDEYNELLELKKQTAKDAKEMAKSHADFVKFVEQFARRSSHIFSMNDVEKLYHEFKTGIISPI